MTNLLLTTIIIILIYPATRSYIDARLIQWRNKTGRTR